MRKEISNLLTQIYLRIGIDQPSNHDQILDFIVNDVKETADPVVWTSEDVNIAFRRFIESINK